MSTEITLTASTAPLPPSSIGSEEWQSVVNIRIERTTRQLAHAKMLLDGSVVLDARLDNLLALCARAIGRPAHEWSALDLGGGVHASVPESYSAIQQNLAKAGLLVSLWLEPWLLRSDSEQPPELHDDLIVDYTGAPGRQRYLYFLGSINDDGLLDRLFRLHLICRIDLAIEDVSPRQYYFIPLVVPGVALHWFDEAHPSGGSTYRAWGRIRAQMARRAQRILRSQP